MINHSLTKSMLFLSTGNILQKYNTKQISEIKGILKLLPVSGTVFLLGLFAIAGTPPFSIFASEISIMISIFQEKLLGLGVTFVLLIAIVFAGIALNLFKMFYGEHQDKNLHPGDSNMPGTACLVVLLIVIAITGLFIPEEIKELILRAQNIIIG